MFENVDGRTDDRWTDAGVTGILLVYPCAFGSGELKSKSIYTVNKTIKASNSPLKFASLQLVVLHLASRLLC